jgi:hypothetical protein
METTGGSNSGAEGAGNLYLPRSQGGGLLGGHSPAHLPYHGHATAASMVLETIAPGAEVYMGQWEWDGAP